MTVTADDREACLAAFDRVLGETGAALRELMPRRAWRLAVPAEVWMRREVVEAVGAFIVSRQRLHERLAATIGTRHAASAMELLPPAPWATLERLGVPLHQVR